MGVDGQDGLDGALVAVRLDATVCTMRVGVSRKQRDINQDFFSYGKKRRWTRGRIKYSNFPFVLAINYYPTTSMTIDTHGCKPEVTPSPIQDPNLFVYRELKKPRAVDIFLARIWTKSKLILL